MCPRGAQVRRVTGSSETPDSSQNTIAARRRRALRRILGPVLGHPAAIPPESRTLAFNFDAVNTVIVGLHSYGQ